MATAVRPARALPAGSRPPNPRRSGLPWRRLRDPAAILTFAVVLAGWAIAGSMAPSYLVPPIGKVAGRMGDIVTRWSLAQSLVYTLLRLLVGLTTAFVIGSILGIAMGANERLSRHILPLVRFVQGIPSLSWVVLAVIWFKGVEVRIWYILLVVTLPGFALQMYDSYRAIPKELRDMVHSFRPSPWARFRELTLPGVVPGIFTGLKVNVGLGIRVVLVAELVGATVGVGNQLLTAEQLFDISSVVAWTLWLGICLVIVQAVLQLVEDRVLAYRPLPGTEKR